MELGRALGLPVPAEKFVAEPGKSRRQCRLALRAREAPLEPVVDGLPRNAERLAKLSRRQGQRREINFAKFPPNLLFEQPQRVRFALHGGVNERGPDSR